MIADVVAAAMFVGVVAYAVLGGADYGCGLWDLTAGTSAVADRARRQIDRSIGPVWEANHVWLIFVLVVLWTGFPPVFQAMMSTLAVPWSLVGLGIVFRGGAFVFRKSSPSYGQARLHGIVFALSSVITPFFLGTIAGAVANGRVPLDGPGDVIGSWTSPLSLVGGLLAVAVTSFLACVLLTYDAAIGGDAELSEWFRRRALVASLVAGALAIGAAATIGVSAPALANGLFGRALPLVVISGLAGTFTVRALRVRRLRQARVGAATAVTAVVGGWGVAQYPEMLVGVASIDDVAAPDVTMWALVAVTGAALVIVVPALVWLFQVVDDSRWR